MAFASCRKTDKDETEVPPKAPEAITGEITTNRTLTADRQWILDGTVFVKSPAVLTIEPGTIIRAKVGSKAALVIDKGAKIMADGTAAKPIVFTSGRDAGARNPGDWGGIILVGRATTNRTTPVQVEGGVAITYGTDKMDDDNSGVLRYVRIEYAGIGVNDSEINALTFYAVGNKTVVENVQTVYANDDAFEFFGGTVNCKNLIAYATADDDFDFDFGYNGSVQFAVAIRDPKFVDAADDGNGIECDNDKDGTDATPITQPKISNMTIIGPNNAANTAARHAYGNRWRRNAKFIFNNSIVLGSQKGGINIESDKSATSYKNGDSQFKNNIVAAYTANFLTNAATSILTAADMQTKALADGNVVFTDANISVKLNNPFSLTAPNFLPAAGSPALSGTWVATTGATAVTYRGAFGTTDWTSGWANWNAQSTAY
ncbi:T9SS C-terminal target domain-containing protein [Pedobacter africanus]|nr:T9SS C-terminal target domain-containing protein [Pedobacter africanus]